MAKYILRRLVECVPLILGVIVINFILIHLAPGDPTYALIGPFQVSEEYLNQVRREFGLDQPLPVQLFNYLSKVLQADLGYSIAFRQPVASLILERVPYTLLLMLTALISASAMGIFLGLVCARKPFSFLDNVSTLVGMIGYSLPVFWLGQMLIYYFAVVLGWMPAQGMLSIRSDPEGIGKVLDILWHLILPAFALGFRYLAITTRFTRSSMLEVMGEEYIKTARAKGLDEFTVLFRHGLRNALLPVITIIGMNFGFVLSGSVLTEIVFAWPGLGRLMYDAIFARDYPVMMGMFVIVSVMVVVINLCVDLLYAVLDPRIRTH